MAHEEKCRSVGLAFTGIQENPGDRRPHSMSFKIVFILGLLAMLIPAVYLICICPRCR